MLKDLFNKRHPIKGDPFLIANNKRFPLLPEPPVLNLKRKRRVKK